MSTDHSHKPSGTTPTDPHLQQTGEHASGHGGHRWMMIACCVPMLLIAGVLVATGVAGAGFVLVAIGCTLMMAVMMGGMGHGGGNDQQR